MSNPILTKRDVIALPVPIEEPPMDHVLLKYLVLITYPRVGVLLDISDGGKGIVLRGFLNRQHIVGVPVNYAFESWKYSIRINGPISC